MRELTKQVLNGTRPDIKLLLPDAADHIRYVNLMMRCWQDAVSPRPNFVHVTKELLAIYGEDGFDEGDK